MNTTRPSPDRRRPPRMYPEDSETDSGEDISEPSARRLAVRELERRIDQLTETAMESSHSQVRYSLALLLFHWLVVS